MKALMFYRDGMDYSRPAEEFVEMFRRKYPGKRLERVDLDTREGAAMATLHDVTSYPAILVSADDGRVLQVWQGENLPLLDEIASFLLEH